MSDVTEKELAAAFASKLGAVSSAIGQRLQAVDYRPAGRARRKFAIGGFGVTPAVLVAAVGTAAAATGGVVLASHTGAKPAAKTVTKAALAKPTPIFQKHHTFPWTEHGGLPADIAVRHETVIVGSVHERASETVPHYGKVQFWAGTTKQGGFCYAIKLPNGSWAGYPMTRQLTGGFYGGAVPGCIDTEQQRSMGHPSAEAPTTIEGFDDEVKSHTGQVWELFFGYVTTQGRAAAVKDPASGNTAPVTPDGYFLLVEHPTSTGGSDMLQVLAATGQPLQPDYARTGLLPGYKIGPTSGRRP